MKVLKIGAVWCNGCNVMRPRWKEIEEELPWLQTEYFEFDDSPEVVAQYGLDEGTLPTFIFLDKTGVEFDRMSGEIEKAELLKILEAYKNR